MKRMLSRLLFGDTVMVLDLPIVVWRCEFSLLWCRKSKASPL